MNKKTAYIILALSFIFFITTFVLYVTREDEKVATTTAGEIAVAETGEKEEEKLPETTGVRIFRLTEASELYIPVDTEIVPSDDRISFYKTFFNRLMEPDDGTIIPAPPGLNLRAVFVVEEDNLLVLDFSEELLKIFPSGSGSALEFIYYFVNNFCYNFPEIGGVRFLIDGDEKASLNGHVDLSGTFTPRFELLSKK